MHRHCCCGLAAAGSGPGVVPSHTSYCIACPCRRAPAEGLHLIDFEQLKIENSTLSYRIEARSGEVLKLRGKLTQAIQVGAVGAVQQPPGRLPAARVMGSG